MSTKHAEITPLKGIHSVIAATVPTYNSLTTTFTSFPNKSSFDSFDLGKVVQTNDTNDFYIMTQISPPTFQKINNDEIQLGFATPYAVTTADLINYTGFYVASGYPSNTLLTFPTGSLFKKNVSNFGSGTLTVYVSQSAPNTVKIQPGTFDAVVENIGVGLHCSVPVKEQTLKVTSATKALNTYEFSNYDHFYMSFGGPSVLTFPTGSSFVKTITNATLNNLSVQCEGNKVIIPPNTLGTQSDASPVVVTYVSGTINASSNALKNYITKSTTYEFGLAGFSPYAATFQDLETYTAGFYVFPNQNPGLLTFPTGSIFKTHITNLGQGPIVVYVSQATKPNTVLIPSGSYNVLVSNVDGPLVASSDLLNDVQFLTIDTPSQRLANSYGFQVSDNLSLEIDPIAKTAFVDISPDVITTVNSASLLLTTGLNAPLNCNNFAIKNFDSFHSVSDVVLSLDASTPVLTVNLSGSLSASKTYAFELGTRVLFYQDSNHAVNGVSELVVHASTTTDAAGVPTVSFQSITQFPDNSKLPAALSGSTISVGTSPSGFSVSGTRQSGVNCHARTRAWINQFEDIT